MSYNENDKLELLNSLKEETFLENSIDILKAEEISLQLRSIPDSQKNKFYDFVKDYLDTSFKRGFEPENIALEDYKIITDVEKEKKNVEEVILEKIDTSKSLISFKVLFDKVRLELKDYFINYKGYFITELVNDPSLNYKLIFLYEDNYHYKPLKGRVKEKFHDFNFIKFDDESIKSLSQEENYLCVFLLMSKMNDNRKLDLLLNNVKAFIDTFQSFNYHSIVGKDDVLLHELINRKDYFIKDIHCTLSTFISNGKINFEEEKIIKKLCSSLKSPLLFYKILSGGFSGSKVLEIRPKKANNFDNEKIFIIKYGYITDGKINEEKNNFDSFIMGRKGFSDYSEAIFESTLHYEGIRYNYAISETSSNSYSFSDILLKNDFPFKDIEYKKDIINRLFNQNEAFNAWREDYNEDKTSIISDLYSNYLSREKIEHSLRQILNDTNKEDEFLALFDKIWGLELTYKESVCHGDLHTDNFFIDDDKKIYLIDFGHTNMRHSILDYTSLECSIKFKHFPFYLESEELINIERELLSENTFNLSYNFTQTKRREILDLLDLINSIRQCSLKDLAAGSNNFEYYISLFVMTIRQIRYPNMNQLYAYHSAKILGEYIIRNTA
jgi:hypothetical protein